MQTEDTPSHDGSHSAEPAAVPPADALNMPMLQTEVAVPAEPATPPPEEALPGAAMPAVDNVDITLPAAAVVPPPLPELPVLDLPVTPPAVADIPIPMPGVVPQAAADREIPTLEVSGVSRIHFVGGEKGGVGKSVVARLMAQYCIDNGVPFTAFDTDRSHGSLMRFYADYTQPALADSYEALDRIVEAAMEQPGRRVLVDLAAQTHDPLVKWMEDSGVLDMADVSGISVQYWHVMDAGRDSVELLRRLLDRFGQRLHYVIVRNQLRGDDFSILERSGQLVRARGLGAKVIDLKHLHDPIVQKIDARNASFWSAKNSNAIDGASLTLMERQRLRLWMHNAYTGIAAAGV